MEDEKKTIMDNKSVEDEGTKDLAETKSENKIPKDQDGLKKKKSLKSLILMFVIAAVVIAGIAFMGIQLSHEKKVQNLIVDGNNYLQALDYEQALAAFQQAIEIDPKSEDAYVGIADTYLAMADSEIKKEEVTEKSFDIASEYMDVSLEILQNGMQMIQTDTLEKKAEEVQAKKNEIQNLKEEYIVKAEEQKRIEEEKQKEEEKKKQEEEKKKKQEEDKKRLLALDSDLSAASIGDIVKYGHKEDYTDALEWIVLDKNEDEILLYAQEALCKATPEDIFEDLQKDLILKCFYIDERVNIPKRELEFGGKSFLPDTDWRVYHNRDGSYYRAKIDRYVVGDVVEKARRKQMVISDYSSGYEIGREGEIWFLLTWDDIRKYLYTSDMEIDNINCDLQSDEFDFEFATSKMLDDMWLVGGFIRYDYYFRDYDEELTSEDIEYYEYFDLEPYHAVCECPAAVSFDSQMHIAVVDYNKKVDFRPAMWVSLNQ